MCLCREFDVCSDIVIPEKRSRMMARIRGKSGVQDIEVAYVRRCGRLCDA